MAGQDDNARFFREGLRHYAEARATVKFFESRVQEAVAAAFDAKTDWANFVPIRVEPDQSLELGKGMGEVFIHSYIAGSIPSRGIVTKVWLSLGLYWNAPLRPGNAIAASHCWHNGNGPTVPFRQPPPGSRVELAALNRRSERRLMIQDDEGFDPEPAFALLLATADAMLGPLEMVGPDGPTTVA